jgi:hypothetical protein
VCSGTLHPIPTEHVLVRRITVLLIAGVMHLPKKDKNAQETLATWTDLIVGVVVVALGAYLLLGAMAP